MVEKTLDGTAGLRYLDATSVCCPSGHLSDFDVCTKDAKSLGNVHGVLISPSMRRCEYLVIQSRGLFTHRRFLVPVEAGAVLEQGPKTLRISARKDELAMETFMMSSVPQFSDDDLIATMFAQTAA